MPAIKSSSKTGTSVVLYGHERKALNSAMNACNWLNMNCTSEVADPALKAFEGLCELLKKLPTPETAAK